MTGPATDLTPQAVAELRHDLRTPVNHIVGYAEMLLEDSTDPAYATCRAALQETLGAARDVLALINATLAPTRATVDRRELDMLYDSLRQPQHRIQQAIGGLLAAAQTPPGATAVDDLRKILAAADRLVPAPAPPASLASRAASAQPAAPSGAAAAARILVVDDQEDNREVLRRRLEREGYVVDCAEHGRAALARMAERPADLVLLDVMMPEVDGYAVLQELKSAPATRDVPVIMISALDDMPSIVRCIERGAEDFLPKPFDPILLRARISASLEKKRLRDQEKRYLEEVQRVIAAASAVEAGTYRAGTLAEVGGREDALGRLARVFDAMATQVKAREDRLRDQVRELRREIDAARTRSAEFSVPLDAGTLGAGQRFGERYEILAVVGEGGMGTVYRVKDLELGEEVAIKTLRPEFVSNATLLERFKSEIRLARRITHRNVVRTHDFGDWRGVYYLSMEFVEGLTVRQLIDMRGRLTVPSALAIGTQLAASLAVAHEQGVIHRDIKPQNLLLDAQGVLKVMDFGVARLAERPSSLTEAGLIVGTPAYMAPEQLLGEEIDGRADLYSAGLVLYECLAGRLPFEATTATALIAKVLTEAPPPLSDLNPDVPGPLSSLVGRLLRKQAQERVQTAAELAQLLERME
ncbi:MAG TPA: response regulator [Gemmatimonadales bacterium]|nr:response regulator [Gemmatimonadales bacterium]